MAEQDEESLLIPDGIYECKWSSRSPVHINPDDGSLEISSDIDRQPIGFTILGTDTAALSGLIFGGGDFKEEVKMAKPKKTKKTKIEEKLSLQDAITSIVRKYIVVRNGSLGMEMSIPASRVPDMIKEINDLVATYIGGIEKDLKKKAVNQEAQSRTLENMQKNIERALDEIAKQRKKQEPPGRGWSEERYTKPYRANPWEWDQEKLARLKELADQLNKKAIRAEDKPKSHMKYNFTGE